jgi:2-isopropylmalate synthase
VLRRIKELELQGFQFEAAEGSFEMLLRRAAQGYEAPFELDDFTVIVEKRGGGGSRAQATVRLRVAGEMVLTAADGDGPVNALDRAVRKALLPHYPSLAEVHLVDYKVRIVDEHLGTGARPRVVIESARGAERWSTVGCSENIIEASWLALCDGLELPLLRDREAGLRSEHGNEPATAGAEAPQKNAVSPRPLPSPARSQPIEAAPRAAGAADA